MRRGILLLGLTAVTILSIGCATPCLETNPMASTVQIVDTIENKLAAVKGYSAEVESQCWNPNGGYDKFQEEQTVCLPDRMLVKRKALVAHNADAVGEEITIVIDGTWQVSRITRAGSDSRHASYSKTNLKAVEKAGGASIPEYISAIGNVVDPFRGYPLHMLKLEKETRDEWFFLVEDKQAGASGIKFRLTIDKKTGFLKEVEYLSPKQYHSGVLLKVKSVIPKDQFEDSLFKLDIPSPDSHGYPYVSDDTDRAIKDFKALEKKVREMKDPEASRRPFWEEPEPEWKKRYLENERERLKKERERPMAESNQEPENIGTNAPNSQR